MSGFKPGDLVVYPGQGLGKIVGVQEVAGKRFLMLELEGRGMRMGLPEELAPSTLRTPMSKDEAEAALALLRSDEEIEPDMRAWPYRQRDAYKTLARGPQSARVQVLHQLYRSPFAPRFGEQKLLFMYEDVVLPELAAVLGQDPDTLKVELRRLQPVFKEGAQLRPDEPVAAPRFPPGPFELPGFTYYGSFRVDARLAIGEPGSTLSAEQPEEIEERHGLLLEMKPGLYLAFREQTAEGEPRSLVAVHESKGNSFLTLLHDAREVSRVIVEGGRVCFLDAGVRNDPDIVDELEFPLFPDALIKDRGVAASTGRNGIFPVLVARAELQNVLVSVQFSVEEHVQA